MLGPKWLSDRLRHSSRERERNDTAERHAPYRNKFSLTGWQVMDVPMVPQTEMYTFPCDERRRSRTIIAVRSGLHHPSLSL